MVRYYGFYSNKSCGLRKKAGSDDEVPALIESEVSPNADDYQMDADYPIETYLYKKSSHRQTG
ncbi:hypothetical protein ACFL0M_10455 [Thermodesulfobacteriota bacterium]